MQNTNYQKPVPLARLLVRTETSRAAPLSFLTHDTHKRFLSNGIKSSPSFKLPASGASAVAQPLGHGFWLARFPSCGQGPLLLHIWRPFMPLLRAPSSSSSVSPPRLSVPVVWAVLALGKDMSSSWHHRDELVQGWACVIH